jgi:serine/threonine protein phosphatase 1
MPTIAVGDIHGNLVALTEVLDQLRDAARYGDTVVFLGDYIDRGPDSKGCIDAILGFRDRCDAEVVCLLGNHEDWFLRTLGDHRRHSWLLGMEAFDTIRSYSTEAAAVLGDAAARAGADLYVGGCELPYGVFFDCLPADHMDFFERLRVSCQTADCVCSHGGLDPRKSLQEQTRHDLMWGTSSFPDAYDGPDIVVYGHRDNAVLDPAGWPMPAAIGRTIGIDTVSHGVVTAVRLPEGRVFQSARHRPQ